MSSKLVEKKKSLWYRYSIWCDQDWMSQLLLLIQNFRRGLLGEKLNKDAKMRFTWLKKY